MCQILEGADVSLLESAALAVWLCANVKERKKQGDNIINYPTTGESRRIMSEEFKTIETQESA